MKTISLTKQIKNMDRRLTSQYTSTHTVNNIDFALYCQLIQLAYSSKKEPML